MDVEVGVSADDLLEDLPEPSALRVEVDGDLDVPGRVGGDPADVAEALGLGLQADDAQRRVQPDAPDGPQVGFGLDVVVVEGDDVDARELQGLDLVVRGRVRDHAHDGRGPLPAEHLVDDGPRPLPAPQDDDVPSPDRMQAHADVDGHGLEDRQEAARGGQRGDPPGDLVERGPGRLVFERRLEEEELDASVQGQRQVGPRGRLRPPDGLDVADHRCQDRRDGERDEQGGAGDAAPSGWLTHWPVLLIGLIGRSSLSPPPRACARPGPRLRASPARRACGS